VYGKYSRKHFGCCAAPQEFFPLSVNRAALCCGDDFIASGFHTVNKGDANDLDNPARDRNRRRHGNQLLRLRRYLTRVTERVAGSAGGLFHGGLCMKILVLGAAAGGGFPQWNSNDSVARRAWTGEISPRSQSSIAVSADGQRWVLFNASPDLRQQIRDNAQLHPAANAPLRASPISAAVLTNADVDHVAGLLNLRERQPLALYGHERVLDVLARNSIFNVLDPAFVTRRTLDTDSDVRLLDQPGVPLGLNVQAFAVPGKIALWLEDTNQPGFGTADGDTLGLRISDDAGNAFFYIPACAAMTPELALRLAGAALVFFDGTLWRDDEMIAVGVGTKTGARMGHMSCDATIAAFAPLNVKRKVFIHINNTNPLFVDGSAARADAEAAGWNIADDGQEITL
jgi:pyrroloquinoline quinone biosynthesis protein B